MLSLLVLTGRELKTFSGKFLDILIVRAIAI